MTERTGSPGGERVYAHGELRSAESNQAFLLKLGDSLRGEGDAERIIARTCEALGRQIGTARVAFCEVLDGPEGRFVATREWNEGVRAFSGPPQAWDGLNPDFRAAIEAGRSLRIEDVEAAQGLKELQGSKSTRSANASVIAVPLIREGELVAYLLVTDKRPRHWTDTEFELTRDVAERTWATLQRARAEAGLRIAQSNQAFLLSLSDAIRDEADPECILACTSDKLGRHLGVSRIVWSELDVATGTFTSPRQWVDGVQAVPPARLGDFDGRAVAALSAGRSLAVHDVRYSEAPHDAETLLANGTAAYLCVPLVKAGRYVATLAATHHEPRRWTDGEIALVEQVAERTWSTLQRARVESELRAAQEQNIFLLRLADLTRDETEPDSILSIIADQLGSHLGISRVAYLEVTEGGRGYRVAREWEEGVRPSENRYRNFADFDEWVDAAAALERGEVLKIIDVRESWSNSAAELCAGDGTAAIMCIPLVKGGRLVAYLALTHHVPRSWSDHEEVLAREVAERTWGTLQRARAEADLRESEALLSAFMENAPIGMYLKDTTGRYLIANSEMEKVFERPVKEVLGRTAHDLCGPEEAAQIAAWDRQLAETGESFSFEQDRTDRTAYRSMLVMRFPVRADPSEPLRIGGFDIDLTEQKKMEAELEKSREALYQSEKLTALGSLLAGISHELNNPLSVVVGQALILEQKATDEATALRASKIRNAAERCARIVQTFLAMARQRQPEKHSLDVNGLIEAALDLTGYGLRAAGVRVRTDFAADLPQPVGDASQLHQLFANLFVNAQHALEAHAGRRELAVLTRARRGQVVIEVADSGPGIPPEIRSRIFEPFFTTKPVGAGTGLGLSFAYGVARAHGGDLALVESEEGTRFRITLPLAGAAGEAASEAAPAASGHGGVALVVDDEVELAETLAEMLEGQGWSTIVAEGGRAAIECIRQRDVDLLITDLRMPDFDGADLFNWVRENRPALAERIVFLTGDTLGPAANRFLETCGRPYGEKPFSPETISRLIQASGWRP